MTATNLPQFSNINLSTVPTEVTELLKKNRQKIDALVSQSHYSWDTLMQPMSELSAELHRFWSKISHMNAVVNSDELRKVYNECLPKLSEYSTEISHNQKLYKAIQSIADSAEFEELDIAHQKVIENELRDFELSGVALPPEQKKRFATLVKELSQLTTKFEENLLDATNQWKKHVTHENALAGLPEHTVLQAQQRAEQENQEGWLLTLEPPCYLAIMMYADLRELRHEVYHAYSTRASDQNPAQSNWDNSDVMHSILEKRLELAKLLGFKNFAQESLATKMADQPHKVMDFLDQLAKASYTKAQLEFKALGEFAKEELGLYPLEAWDVAYTTEKLRQHRYHLSQEELKPYFCEQNVTQGLFDIVSRLFKITLREVKNVDTWHPDVKCFALYSEKNKLISYCYFDLYARAQKRGGAWMDDYSSRYRLADGSFEIPVAFVTCNFNAPTQNTPALFTHDEVITLFHEFGHALQHMLTTVDCLEVSGINGIPWDAVELASQFLENWAWQKESLALFAKHYQSGELLPDELFTKLNNAKNFQSAMQMVRQLEFSLFDFRLHLEFDPKEKNQVQKILDEVRKQVSVVPIPKFNRFQHGFSHIFAGGYAAGYYSYKWAEVMASDAFSLFLEKGIFDAESARKFLIYILQPGGSEDPAILFARYRGREPQVDALLVQSGIKE